MSHPARRLLEELRTYKPADETEERHHRTLMGHLVHAKSPLNRSKFAPGHVTASLFIVDPATQRVLLHHHRRLDRWLQMGGHLEAGEAPGIAALREGREESGLGDLELLSPDIFDVDVHLIPAHDGDRTISTTTCATSRAPPGPRRPPWMRPSRGTWHGWTSTAPSSS